MYKLYDELFEAAIDLGLSPRPFHIEFVSPDSINELQQKGIAKRLSLHKVNPSHSMVSELFDVIDQTVYIRDDQSEPINQFIIAHCMAHADFINNNNHISDAIRMFKNQYPAMRHQFEQVRYQLSYSRFNSISKALNELYQAVFLRERDVFKLYDQFGLDSEVNALWGVYNCENRLFQKISQTALMNEGWATFYEYSLLKHAGLLSPSIQQVANKKNQPYHKGINLYRLGQILWNQVGKNERFLIRKKASDYSFIERIYSPYIHESETISVVHPSQDKLTNNYDIVKQQLKMTACFAGKLLLTLNQDQSEEKESVMFNYPIDKYHDSDIRVINKKLEALLNLRIYIKPN